MASTTNYVIDPGTAIALASGGAKLRSDVKLLAPTLLRSQVLTQLYAGVRRGELDDKVGRDLVQTVNELPVRLLGDARLRRRAWALAAEQGWDDTYDAEYVALTILWGEALVTSNPDLLAAAEGVVETASIDVLTGGRD